MESTVIRIINPLTRRLYSPTERISPACFRYKSKEDAELATFLWRGCVAAYQRECERAALARAARRVGITTTVSRRSVRDGLN
jgi:hypothetical protein